MANATNCNDMNDQSTAQLSELDVIDACDCCNSRDFEDVQLLEQDLADGKNHSQTPQQLCPEQLRSSYLERLGGKHRKGMLNTIQYMKNRHQSKHPDREAFRPRKFATRPQELSYNRWKFKVRKGYEVIDNILHMTRSGKPSLIVATPTNALFLIAKAHKQIQHGKISATYLTLKQMVHGITREDVQWYVDRCPVCELNKMNPSKPSVQATTLPRLPKMQNKPVPERIVSSRVLERVQISLIDLQWEPSGEYSWILHARDHLSKHTTLYPLKSKSSADIASCLQCYIRHYGPPELIQSDHTPEFKNEVSDLMRKRNIKLIYNRGYSLHTHGSVIRANGIVKEKLGSWKASTGRDNWADALGEISFAMNRSPCSALPRGITPNILFYKYRTFGNPQSGHSSQ